MDGVLLALRLALAAVFITAALSKLMDRSGARRAAADFGVPERLVPTVASGLPLAELAVGAALVPAASARWGALGALTLLTAFSLGIAVNLSRGNAPECHCFGQLGRRRMSWRSLLRNTLLLSAALSVALAGSGEAVGSVLAQLAPAERIGVIGLIAAVVVVGLEWRLLVRALADNGSALLALERLEMAVSVGTGVIPAGLTKSLPVGTPAPAFALPSTDGQGTTLDALLSPRRPLLLVFTEPKCQPCKLMLPEVATWQAQYGDRVTTVIIAQGELERNRALSAQYGVNHMLVQQGREVSDAYRVPATPCAVIVRSDGTIGSGVSPGIEPIRLLLAAALRGAAADDHASPSSGVETALARGA